MRGASEYNAKVLVTFQLLLLRCAWVHAPRAVGGDGCTHPSRSTTGNPKAAQQFCDIPGVSNSSRGKRQRLNTIMKIAPATAPIKPSG